MLVSLLVKVDLYSKIIIILIGVIAFCSLMYLGREELGLKVVLNSYMLSSIIVFISVYLFLFFHQRSFLILQSFIKVALIGLTFYVSLKYSLIHSMPIDNSTALVSFEFIFPFLTTIFTFVALYVSIFVLISLRQLRSLINSKSLYNMFKK